MIKTFIKKMVGQPLADHLFYRRHFRRLLHRLDGKVCRRVDGEQAYRDRWHRLSPLVEPYSYRLYSRYCGPTPDIIPFDLLHNIVEPRLNPPALWLQYEDKNRFAEYVDPSLMPATVALRSNGGPIVFVSPLSSLSFPLIIKPSVNRSCGEGIMRFERVGGRYLNADGTELTDRWLQSYGTDFILQEAIEQHPFMSNLCSTAVCTIRLAVYRSVVDGRAHVTAGVLRVGRNGSVVDNIVAGGRFVGIDVKTGALSDTFIGRFGDRSPVWNGVDISRQRLVVPHWDSVVDLAVKVADAVVDHHLLALDIALASNEKPMLIEYNIGGFSAYLFHFVGQTVFGPYTGEVVDYCLTPQARALARC